jgi:queuine/archaeosine tRNA-ribosyltransferase
VLLLISKNDDENFDILLWIGEQKIPIMTDRTSDFVMDSVINYYDDERPRLAYRAGNLFIDSGAFTASVKGLTLEKERVIFIQESLHPTFAIPLDFPFRPGMLINDMKKRWEMTKDNILYWQHSSTIKKIVPPLHAWNKESLLKHLLWLQKHANSEYIAIGSIVNPNFTNFSGFFGDRQPNRELIDMIAFAIKSIKEHSDFKVHLMGFGSSPLMLHLGYYLGAESIDSSGYRRKAAYGKIILPGTGERYVGNSSANFGVTPLSSSKNSKEVLLLQKCDCPICIVNQDLLWSDWKARAIHNEHVIKKEAQIARQLIQVGADTYEMYLDKVVFANSSLKYLWEYAKLRKKFYRISEILFEKG